MKLERISPILPGVGGVWGSEGEVCRAALSSMVAMSHMCLADTWNVTRLNVASVKHTSDFEDLVWKKECKLAQQ